MTDNRFDSIEARLAEERKPNLENLLRNVAEQPGYHNIRWQSALYSKSSPRRQWYVVIKKALRDKHIERDLRGKFWLYGTKRPSDAEMLLFIVCAVIDDMLSFTIETLTSRAFYVGLLTAYVVFGLFFGVVMQKGIPAINTAGLLYYAAIWPWFFASGGFGAPDPYIPQWVFTYS